MTDGGRRRPVVTTVGGITAEVRRIVVERGKTIPQALDAVDWSLADPGELRAMARLGLVELCNDQAHRARGGPTAWTPKVITGPVNEDGVPVNKRPRITGSGLSAGQLLALSGNEPNKEEHERLNEALVDIFAPTDDPEP
jgi:hypothetical protein